MTENSATKYLILPIWILAILSLGTLVHAAPSVFLWIISSVLLFALLDPMFDWLKNRKVHPSLAAILLILSSVIAFVLLISVLGYFSAGILAELQESKRALIQFYNSLNENIKHLLETFSSITKDVSPSAPTVGPKVQKVEVIEGSILGGEMGTTLIHGLGSAVTVLTYTVLVPILTLFLMLSRPSFARIIPMAFTDPARAQRMWQKLIIANRAFFLGNLFLAALSFPLFTLLFYIFSIKSPLTMAALSSVFNLVPFLGAALAGLLPVLDTASQNGPLPTILLLFGLCILIHFIIANFITPHILGSKVDLNAVVSTLAIIVWGELWGPVGILLGIPITASIKIIFEESGFPWLHWLAALMSERPDEILKLDVGRKTATPNLPPAQK
ncbi:AI-2E family transporter [Bdellovibrio sp. SKB1291214]|uniref:AI-2E family transporter n=1 Tax=Bdellovibrio sp. SKB1291214 TaxID=1732569 RepID=UPI000B51D806|nr:AI-2E family transporter [Bdellovibrio sp. SKB1291214]UYL07228.1 AI-2E family transporter [Bdellovibrio sp. SKB1291214]